MSITGVHDIPQRARDQAGVFTAQQALDEGWSHRQIRRRLADHRWDYVAGLGMARASSAAWSAHQLAIAAQLTVPSAVTSHVTAAALHGFPVPQDGCSHIVTRKLHRNLRNIVTHRIPLTSSEATAAGGLLMVTTPQRTAFDCLALLQPEAQLRLWAWVTTRNIVTVTSLARAIDEREGRPGVTSLRSLLILVQDGAVSVAERRFLELLRSAGLTGWVSGATVEDEVGIIAVVDVLFRAERLVIEIDGYSAHSSRDAFVRDRRRQNRLVEAGFTVLRFSWDDLTTRPDDVIARVRRALGRTSARP